MALTPDIFETEDFTKTPAVDEELAVEEEVPKRTWRIDFDNGRIGGQITGIDAIKQYVYKALTTARSRYLIYTDDYGSELAALIGSDVTRAYLDAEIPRMVRDALIYHGDINDVTDIKYELSGDALFISLTLDTIYGELRTEVTT